MASVTEVLGHKIFWGEGLDGVSQHRQFYSGAGRPRDRSLTLSSSGCSPSAQTLLSCSQSRSSTFSSEQIMHFLNRPPCRGSFVKFRRRCSECPVPGKN